MKFKCKDVAFCLMTRLESIDRLENALMILEYLEKNFETNIYIWEFSHIENGILRKLSPKGVKYTFVYETDPVFHMTKYRNMMVRSVKEKYVSLWDIDIIAPVSQITKSIELLRYGVDIVLPYEKTCYDTSPEIRKVFFHNREIDFLLHNTAFMTEMYPPICVGGLFFANRQTYINSGLDNEKFYGWGLEDRERYERWRVQKRQVERVPGPIFHLTHFRGVNSFAPSADSRLIKQRIFDSSIREEAWKNI